MTTMLTRASQAVEDALESDDNHPDDISRAVLMAVRDPPPEVVEAGMIAGGFNGMADLAFTAMIDAILAGYA